MTIFWVCALVITHLNNLFVSVASSSSLVLPFSPSFPFFSHFLSLIFFQSIVCSNISKYKSCHIILQPKILKHFVTVYRVKSNIFESYTRSFSHSEIYFQFHQISHGFSFLHTDLFSCYVLHTSLSINSSVSFRRYSKSFFFCEACLDFPRFKITLLMLSLYFAHNLIMFVYRSLTTPPAPILENMLLQNKNHIFFIYLIYF